MTRFGLLMLVLFAVLAGGFALLTSPATQGTRTAEAPAPATATGEVQGLSESARAPRQALAALPSADPAVPQPGSGLIVPVVGVARAQLTDSWGDPRGGGARSHQAIDIMAPRGTPVVAAAPGVVEKLFNSEAGGLTVYVRSPDGGIVHYYSHLDRYRPGLAEGQRLQRGEVIGTVGSTGNAGPDAPHLHFEVKRMAPGEAWHQGTAVNPYPLLVGR